MGSSLQGELPKMELEATEAGGLMHVSAQIASEL